MIDKEEIIKKKIEKINKSKYKYTIEFEHIKDRDVLLKYGVHYKTSSNLIIKSIGFQTINELYVYILGFMDALEIY